MQEETISTTYTVRAGSFEGPLELLLSLIEERKLFVNEISLADVTNEYIAHLKSLSTGSTNQHIANVSYFIVIASTLILIKSKSLLPNLSLTEDEEEKIEDLEQRLKLYRCIKNISFEVKKQFGVSIIFQPCDRVWSEPLFSPDPEMTLPILASSIQEVLKNIPVEKEILPEVEIRKVINIDQMIDNLTDRIQEAMTVSFKQFSQSQGAENKEEARVHIIVSFLAMLELVREGIIDVIQNVSFEDISISKIPVQPLLKI